MGSRVYQHKGTTFEKARREGDMIIKNSRVFTEEELSKYHNGKDGAALDRFVSKFIGKAVKDEHLGVPMGACIGAVHVPGQGILVDLRLYSEDEIMDVGSIDWERGVKEVKNQHTINKHRDLMSMVINGERRQLSLYHKKAYEGTTDLDDVTPTEISFVEKGAIPVGPIKHVYYSGTQQNPPSQKMTHIENG